MFDKLRELESRLIRSGDLDKDLHSQAKHKRREPLTKDYRTIFYDLPF